MRRIRNTISVYLYYARQLRKAGLELRARRYERLAAELEAQL